MRIGVFDSGVGGLLIFRSVVEAMPEYDYVYYGDTARVPYGNRSQETIYQFLEEAVAFLFAQDCSLIIVACNTASAEALRRIQQEYLPAHFPDRRVLGVIIPAAEAVAEIPSVRRVGLLATHATVGSGAYVREIHKLRPDIEVVQNAAPLLVPLIENNEIDRVEPFLREYLAPLLKAEVDVVILGCTHYPLLKHQVAEITRLPIVSQDEVIPEKLRAYLGRHPEIEQVLSKQHGREFFASDITPALSALSAAWFGDEVVFKKPPV
jgi:glutamate racemase